MCFIGANGKCLFIYLFIYLPGDIYFLCVFIIQHGINAVSKIFFKISGTNSLHVYLLNFSRFISFHLWQSVHVVFCLIVCGCDLFFIIGYIQNTVYIYLAGVLCPKHSQKNADFSNKQQGTWIKSGQDLQN